MSAPKGTMPPNAGRGRPEGVPNKVTADIREAFQILVEGNISLMQGWIEKLAEKDPGKALDVVVKLAEFIVPKLQRTEIDGRLDTSPFQLAPNFREYTPQEAADAYARIMKDPRPFAAREVE